MKNTFIIIGKQFKDLLKNKLILLQFVLYPIMAIIMENLVHIEDMPQLFFTKLFSVMYIGMAPIVATSAIISEEKEKNTLKVLFMANVKSWEYLLGVGLYVFIICMIGAFSMSFGFQGIDKFLYLCIMGIGFVISIIIGAIVGVVSKNQMQATSLVMPVMLIFSFGPMIAMFNDTVKTVSKVFFTEQIMQILNNSFLNPPSEAYIVFGISIVLFVATFVLVFKKKGLE